MGIEQHTFARWLIIKKLIRKAEISPKLNQPRPHGHDEGSPKRDVYSC